MTTLVTTPAELRNVLGDARVAFVPTMGALHEGHLSLVRIAHEHADVVVVSIFVNPLQFGPGEDFERYPRTLNHDVDLLTQAGVDIVFAPSVTDIYPDGQTALTVHAGSIAAELEGRARPGHFDGMLTVVRRLFDIVQPAVAVFGQKDAQQLALVRQLVDDADLPIEIVAAPISRETDGLARSSRNRYLTAEQRAAAPAIFQALQLAGAELELTGAEHALAVGRAHIDAQSALQVEYFELVDPATFRAPDHAEAGRLIVTAVRAGTTRLLDNLPLG